MPSALSFAARRRLKSGMSTRMAQAGRRSAAAAARPRKHLEDAGNLGQHLGDAHDGDLLGAEEQLHPPGGQARASHSEEAQVRAAGLERGDELGGVGVAGGLSGDDENLWGSGHRGRAS